MCRGCGGAQHGGHEVGPATSAGAIAIAVGQVVQLEVPQFYGKIMTHPLPPGYD